MLRMVEVSGCASMSVVPFSIGAGVICSLCSISCCSGIVSGVAAFCNAGTEPSVSLCAKQNACAISSIDMRNVLSMFLFFHHNLMLWDKVRQLLLYINKV